MTILILDSSLIPFVALVSEGKITQKLLSPKASSKEILNVINDLLKEPPLEIWIGRGVGSFMGQRSSICVGRALAYAYNIPLKTFPSYLPFYPKDNDGPIKLIASATQNSYHLLNLEKGYLLSPPQLISKEDFAKEEAFIFISAELVDVESIFRLSSNVIEDKILLDIQNFQEVN